MAARTVLSRAVGSPERDIHTAIAKNAVQPTPATLIDRNLIAGVADPGIAMVPGTTLVVVISDIVNTFRAAVGQAAHPRMGPVT